MNGLPHHDFYLYFPVTMKAGNSHFILNEALLKKKKRKSPVVGLSY